MKHGSLFSGIGGFDLAAKWMGWENIFHCEWNEFGQKVLHHYWPKAIQYNDITKTDFSIHRGEIDIITGGFPCQPYSMAGKRKGKEDERHLWPQMLRAIREIQPRWVVGENVLGLVNWNGGLVFHEVQTDLEAAGYEVWPYVLPAVSVDAPHRRDRVWFVAYATSNGYKNRHKEAGGKKRSGEQWGMQQFEGMGGEWAITNPNGVRLQQCEDTGEVGRGQAEMGGQGSEFTNAIETNGEAANVTNPNGNGFNQRNGNDEKQPSERGFNALGNADKGNEYGDVADTNNEGLQRKPNKGEDRRTESYGISNRRENTIGTFCTKWEEFPTQPPVCSRNDGLSSRLDGITFSKWRNESIKAAGNAIVPQVVYQIFKAIQQYETLPRIPHPL